MAGEKVFYVGHKLNDKIVCYNIFMTQEPEIFKSPYVAFFVSIDLNCTCHLENDAKWCVYRRREDGKFEKVNFNL